MQGRANDFSEHSKVESSLLNKKETLYRKLRTYLIRS